MKFKVGDKVRIRSWESMEAEFRGSSSVICCELSFHNDMKYLCGKVGTIKDIEYGVITLVDDYGKRFTDPWNISKDMLELVEEHKQQELQKRKFKVGDKVRVRSWESMQAEFSTNCAGDLDICRNHGSYLVFNRNMKKLCGLEFMIAEINGILIKGHDWIYSIVSEMLELVEEVQSDSIYFDLRKLTIDGYRFWDKCTALKVAFKDENFMSVRAYGKYKNKAFHLDNTNYKWKLTKDNSDDLCLVPIPRKGNSDLNFKFFSKDYKGGEFSSYQKLFDKQTLRDLCNSETAQLFMQVRSGGKYDAAAFWLDPIFSWELIKNPDGGLCLLPTKYHNYLDEVPKMEPGFVTITRTQEIKVPLTIKNGEMCFEKVIDQVLNEGTASWLLDMPKEELMNCRTDIKTIFYNDKLFIHDGEKK